MGIEDDGRAVLQALATWEEKPEDPERGRYCLGMSELHQTVFPRWAIPKLNDAVSWLLKKRYVEDDETGGSVPFEMNTLTLTLEGRLAAESLSMSTHTNDPNEMTTPSKKKIFVIYGRNEHAQKQMGIFLRALGLEPLWFRDVRQEMGGTATIIDVVERGMKLAHGALALFTPDEFSTLRPDARRPTDRGSQLQRWQARPNVLFEAGVAFGRDRHRVAFVVFGNVELFTDASGIFLYRPTNDHGPDSDRAQLRGLLSGGMGCDVDIRSNDWMEAGDFDIVTKGLSEVSPRDPFRS